MEALRWDSIPLAEAVVIASWTEFQLAQRDPAFLPDLLLKPRPSQSYGRSANDVLSQQYSKNRLHQTKDDFVIYTNLGVSAQRVPEPDPLPGISFDTRPDPIQF